MPFKLPKSLLSDYVPTNEHEFNVLMDIVDIVIDMIDEIDDIFTKKATMAYISLKVKKYRNAISDSNFEDDNDSESESESEAQIIPIDA